MQEQGKESSTDSQNKKKENNLKEKKDLICCHDAGLGYENKAIIAHFNFEVQSGDYVCVVGENGSGKSTLLKTILGLIKQVSGEVVLSDDIKNGAIGYLPQQTQVQRNFPASVMEVVMSGFLNQKKRFTFYRNEDKKRAIYNMKRLGIESLQKACYGNLSGGQQQRVLLARALCAARDILVLDEPVTGLDPMAAAELYDNLHKLHQEGMAIVMVTHDLKSTVHWADKILHLSNGSYFFGSVHEYMDSDFSDIFSIHS